MCEKILHKYGMTTRNYQNIIAMRPSINTINLQKVQRNTASLERYLSNSEIKSCICRYPKLLEGDIDIWEDFLNAYEVSKKDIRNMILYSYAYMTETNIYDFGIRILNLKSFGFTDEEIRRLYIPIFIKKI
jgi:hypothetical protein